MQITALPTDIVRALQAGGADAYGQTPERRISDGTGTPCRHCLREVPAGADMLICAYRPFAVAQPYAETGPIFLCADPCRRGGETDTLPEIFRNSPDYLLKGYSVDDRIVYGTGAIIKSADIAAYAKDVFEDPEIAYIHVRSARNNCYQARIDRD